MEAQIEAGVLIKQPCYSTERSSVATQCGARITHAVTVKRLEYLNGRRLEIHSNFERGEEKNEGRYAVAQLALQPGPTPSSNGR